MKTYTIPQLRSKLGSNSFQTVTSINLPVWLYLVCRLLLKRQDDSGIPSKNMSKLFLEVVREKISVLESRGDVEFSQSEVEGILERFRRSEFKKADLVRQRLGMLPAEDKEDVASLQGAKQLLSMGLITDEDYQAIKGKVVRKIADKKPKRRTVKQDLATARANGLTKEVHEHL